MDDSISRKVAKDYIRNQCMASDMPEEWVNGVMWAVSELNRVPSAPRPTGRWGVDYDGCVYCVNCGNPAEINCITGEFIKSPFCSECGARMEGGDAK